MLFQTLDDKSECVGIYCDGRLIFDQLEIPELTHTWKYSEHLRGLPDIEYANLRLLGKPLEEAIPEYLRDDIESATAKMKAFERTLKIAKVSMADHCIYDLTPERFLIDICEVKNRLTEHVLDAYPKPKRYKYHLLLCQMLERLSHRDLNINTGRLEGYLLDENTKAAASRVVGKGRHIKYNQFGTTTGRLTTTPTTFPILTLRKDMRSIVEPHNSCFLELDFNGAEARTMISMLGMPQPTGDIHQFHLDNVFEEGTTRPEAKQVFFSWLYGSAAAAASPEGKLLQGFYSKDKILEKYWDGSVVTTPLGRVINDVDEHHALNYIVQSTTAELTLLQAMKIDEFLRVSGARSFISCLIHDAVVLDFHESDEGLLADIKRLMSSTKFGDFGINVSRGSDLGNLEKE